jgi:hypothetical protein
MNSIHSSITGAVAALMTVALAGCGGSSASAPAATTYTIGGVVIGLRSGASVPILYGNNASLTASANGAFTVPTPVTNGTTYILSVGAPPTGQSCGVQNGSGIVSAANVKNIFVYCTGNVTDATLTGTYDLASLNIDNDADQLFSAVPFNGTGTQGASTVTTDQAGTITTGTDNGGAYSVTTVVALPVLTSGTNSQGAIAGADGDEFFWLSNLLNANGAGPGIVFGVKPLANATTASLAGTWTTVGLTQASAPYIAERTLTINADGSFSGNQSTLDVTGVAATQAISGPANSYSVTNNLVSAGGSNGYISANGNFAILAFATPQTGGATANYPQLTVAIKQGTGVTVATLNGVYAVGSLGYNTATTGNGESITMFFDGLGNYGGTYAANANGVSSSSGTLSGTYTVTAGGVLTLTDASGAVYPGVVSADGNLLAAATLTGGGGQAPQMFVGFKQ